MYVDTTPVTIRRSADARRMRGACRKAAQPVADAARRRPASAAARRTRLADAIVSQWLLEQVPAEHRHPLSI